MSRMFSLTHSNPGMILVPRKCRHLHRSPRSLQTFPCLFVGRLLVNLNYTPGRKMLTFEGLNGKANTRHSKHSSWDSVSGAAQLCRDGKTLHREISRLWIQRQHPSSSLFKGLVFIRNAGGICMRGNGNSAFDCLAALRFSVKTSNGQTFPLPQNLSSH